MPMSIELFPDQREALDKVLARYKEMAVGGRALVVAPTAWGKTIFFSALINALDLIKKGIPVLIIAHRDELLDQARDKFHMFDPTAIVGKVGGGRHEYGAPVTVASIDTISGEKHLENLPNFKYGLVIIDECHHSPAPKYMKVLNILKEAFQLGVTATDERLDGKSLEPIFGKALFRMPIVEAIAKKRLSDIKAIAIRTEVNLDTVHSKKNMEGEVDFNQQELDLAVNTPARNMRIVEAYQEHCPGERAICFAVTVAHGQAIADAFSKAGISSACIHGNTNAQPIEERKQIYAAFDRGEILVLTNVLVLTEGFDQPKIKGILMARPTQSRSLYLQCIGRGLRKSPGKTHCVILDLTDNCDKYRLKPQSIRKAVKDIQDGETILESIEREKSENEEREVQVRKLNEKRLQDIYIDLFEKLEWQEMPNGAFVLEVGKEKHRIALWPSAQNSQKYMVMAKLAPNYQLQHWTDEVPLDYAQQEAEKKARLILDGKISWVDKLDPGRNRPPTESQLATLQKFHIPIPQGCTFGQASDLIGAKIAQFERQKAAKKDVIEA
jgi:superfamily II DNA or RNA helicase